MGMVPIPVISPLTISRSEEPTLEPTIPTARVHQHSSNNDDQAGEGYSPAHPSVPSEEAQQEPDSTSPPTDPDPDHELNLFA